MKPFLEKIAERLIEKYPNNMHQVHIILPSKRAIVFLKNYISKKIKKAVFLPKITSIEDFILEVSALEILDNISLQFKLFKSYKRVSKKSTDSFDEFLKWSTILLNDFNDIDRNLVDAKQLFTNLRDLKKLDSWTIEDWSLAEKKLTKVQQNYISFFEDLYLIYNDFTMSLIESFLSYQGLAYKIASEKITDYELNVEKVWFVGLNALTKSEQVIIDYLKNKDIARVFWDADKLYYDNPIHEAGSFLREQREKWHEIDFNGVGNYWSVRKNNFQIIACPKSMSQVKVASEVLSQFNSDDLEKSKTAVVLADESLLYPMLNYLPSNVKKLNVTMGSELKKSSMFSFFQLIFDMQLYALNNKENKFYYKHVLDLVSHPYFIKLINRDNFYNFKLQLTKDNVIFLDHSYISSFFEKNNLFKYIFSKWNTGFYAVKCVREIIQLLFNHILDSKSSFDSEIIVFFEKLITHLETIINKIDFDFELKTFHVLFNQLVSQEKVPFQGEPLQGLQMMGILESRTLDFKNIIMLGVNEGIIPKNQTNDSFITYDLRKFFKMPTNSQKDAVFAYHFYRLLQRSENITLIYNSEIDRFGLGEKSRFITQLLSEYKVGKIKQSIYQSYIPELKEKKKGNLTIENKNLENDIINWMKRGVSASSLIKYISCSLSFYYHYIAKITPKKEIEEFAESSTLGNVIHKSLEECYPTGFLTEKILLDIQKTIPNKIKLLFQKNLSNNSFSTGKNYLSLKVLQRLVFSFLSLEIKMLKENLKNNRKVKILSHELEINHRLSFSGVDINLFGFIDRVDKVGDDLRIIDYKTGKIDVADLIFENIDELFVNPKKSKAFQLLMYVYLYVKKNPKSVNSKISAGIFSFKNLKSGLLYLSVKEKNKINKLTITNEIINTFEEKLKSLLSRILNDDFVETDDKKSYEWIDYSSIYRV